MCDNGDLKKDKKKSKKDKELKSPVEAQPPLGPLVALGKPRDKLSKRPRCVTFELWIINLLRLRTYHDSCIAHNYCVLDASCDSHMIWFINNNFMNNNVIIMTYIQYVTQSEKRVLITKILAPFK